MRGAALLAVLLVAGAYALHNGVYVGTEVIRTQDGSAWWWKRECYYLFPSGTVTRQYGGWAERAGAENEVCRLFLVN